MYGRGANVWTKIEEQWLNDCANTFLVLNLIWSYNYSSIDLATNQKYRMSCDHTEFLTDGGSVNEVTDGYTITSHNNETDSSATSKPSALNARNISEKWSRLNVAGTFWHKFELRWGALLFARSETPFVVCIAWTDPIHSPPHPFLNYHRTNTMDCASLPLQFKLNPFKRN